MNLNFKIKLYQRGKKASFYTIKFDSEADNEFDKFLTDPEISNNNEFQPLVAQLEEILEKYGCQDRFFKMSESTFLNNVVALWRGNLRLYCCRYSNIILIIGSGGIKKTRTYQEDAKLDQIVQMMAHVSNQMDERILNNEITFKNNLFEGNLSFQKDE